jgi:hypothetical protein
MRDAQDPKRLGGSVVCTVTSDDRHTIHLWHWMTQEDAFCKTMYIPGWCYGPDKKLRDLQAAGRGGAVCCWLLCYSVLRTGISAGGMPQGALTAPDGVW